MVELDDLTVVLGKLPALMSRTELELSLHDLDEPRELHRARTEPDLSDSILLRQTVRSRSPPHRSLRQDWKRFLVPIGRYACATFEGPPSSRSRATLLAPSASGVNARTPLVVTRCKPSVRVLDVLRGRFCRSPLHRVSRAARYLEDQALFRAAPRRTTRASFDARGSPVIYAVWAIGCRSWMAS